MDEDESRTCPKRRTLLGEWITNEQYDEEKKNGDTHDLMLSRKKHGPIIKLGSVFHT